jgi:hypothetical protein
LQTVKINSWDRRATNSAGPIARALLAVLPLALLVLGACATSTPAAKTDPPPGVATASLRPSIEFSFETDDQPVSSEATRGVPTVISFITTSSLSSQAQVDFLVAMARHDGDRVRYAVVVLDAQENRDLVALYKKALSIPFPVALADSPTIAGMSGFGDVSGVPVTVLLDRAGRLVARIDGRVVKSDEMRAAMRGL